MNEHLTLFQTYAEYVAFKNTPEAMTLPHVSYIENMPICYYHPWVRVLHPVIRATFNATADNMMPITGNYGVIKNLKIDGETIFTASSVSNTQTFNIKGNEVTYDPETQICTCPQDYLVDLTDDVKAIRLTVTPKNIEECSGFGIIFTVNGMTTILAYSLSNLINSLYIFPIGYNRETCTFTISTLFISLVLMGLFEGAKIDNISGICLKNCSDDGTTFSTIDSTCKTLIVKGETMTADDLIPHLTEGVHELEVELVDNASIEHLFGATCVTDVTYMEDVLTIGDNAFPECIHLTNITIPDSVTVIENNAFSSCNSLTSVTIPDSVTTIGDFAFNHCTNLTSITIPDSVTTIGVEVFSECTSLPVIDNIMYADIYLVKVTDTTLTTYQIKENTKFIGVNAFSSCDSLTSITIPDSVTTIGDEAFNGCTNLVEFNSKFASEDGRCLIVDGTLNSFAPAGLTSYTIPDSVTTIGYGAFSDCDSLISVTIPDSVTTIGGDAFSSCNSLTSVTIPDSVTTIGNIAFSSCGSLTSVTIGNSVATIGWKAFYECDSLISVTIPDSVTTIGWGAFEYCDSLTSVTIGDSVTTIGDSAFDDCYSLTSVYCKATTPPSLGDNVFDYNVSGRKIYVPMASVDAYKTANGWNEYASDIEGYEF